MICQRCGLPPDLHPTSHGMGGELCMKARLRIKAWRVPNEDGVSRHAGVWRRRLMPEEYLTAFLLANRERVNGRR